MSKLKAVHDWDGTPDHRSQKVIDAVGRAKEALKALEDVSPYDWFWMGGVWNAIKDLEFLRRWAVAREYEGNQADFSTDMGEGELSEERMARAFIGHAADEMRSAAEAWNDVAERLSVLRESIGNYDGDLGKADALDFLTAEEAVALYVDTDFARRAAREIVKRMPKNLKKKTQLFQPK